VCVYGTDSNVYCELFYVQNVTALLMRLLAHLELTVRYMIGC
jgi:hypothetical protein